MSTAQQLIQNFIGGYHKSDVRIANLSETINMFPETQGEGASTSTVLRSILGTSVLLNISTDKCRGLIRCSRDINGNSILFGVFGQYVYVIRKDEDNNYTSTQIGTVNNIDDPVSLTETGGEGSAHPHLVIADGASVFAVATDMSDADMIADYRSIALPNRVNSDTEKILPSLVCYYYNYLIVVDSSDGSMRISTQYPFEETSKGSINYDVFEYDYNGSTFTAVGNVLYSEWKPDRTTGIIANSSYFYSFGHESAQIWYWTDDLSEPIKTPTNAAMGIGLRAPHSLIGIGNAIFWLASASIGEDGVYMYSGSTFSRISNADIERLISTMTHPEDAIGQTWEEDGHVFYALTFVTDDLTLVYDTEEQKWHRRSTKDADLNTMHAWAPKFAKLYDNKICFGTDDGNIIYLDNDKYTEYDGKSIIRVRRGGAIYNNYSPFFCDSFKIICNSGDITDSTLNPTIHIRWCWDGGEWSNQQQMLMGKIGQYGYDCTTWTLGLGKVLNVEISYSEATNFVLLACKIQSCVTDSF